MSAISTRIAVTTAGVLCAAALGAGGVLGAQAFAAPATPAVDAVALVQAPEGARAQVAVSPNPAHPGDTVTITGNCGGGPKLTSIIGGIPGGFQALENIKVVDPNPKAFRATATVGRVGAGVGPVFVDCSGEGGSGEAGVTLLVTQPAGH